MQFAISYAVGKFECVLCPDVLEIPEMLQGCFNIKWDWVGGKWIITTAERMGCKRWDSPGDIGWGVAWCRRTVLLSPGSGEGSVPLQSWIFYLETEIVISECLQTWGIGKTSQSSPLAPFQIERRSLDRSLGTTRPVSNCYCMRSNLSKFSFSLLQLDNDEESGGLFTQISFEVVDNV
jgi:hypothetical protein